MIDAAKRNSFATMAAVLISIYVVMAKEIVPLIKVMKTTVQVGFNGSFEIITILTFLK